MATIIAVPPLAGVNDLVGLLRFLSDPEAVRARLEALEAYKVACDTRLAEIGAAEDWAAAGAQARADRQMARETLEHAKAEAVAIRGTAIEERDAAVAEAARTRQALQQERDALDRAIAQAATAQADRDAQLMAREAAAADAAARAAETIQEATVLRAELAAKLSRLRAAAESVT